MGVLFFIYRVCKFKCKWFFIYTRNGRDSKVRLRARSFLKVTKNKEQKALLRWYLSKSGCPDEAIKKQKRAKFT